MSFDTRRSPHGERGLKCFSSSLSSMIPRRSPHGERGLKFLGPQGVRRMQGSLSSRRAWIEITTIATSIPLTVSLSSRRAWIEI